jgi:DNA-binding CsgD family transcriptional regulator
LLARAAASGSGLSVPEAVNALADIALATGEVGTACALLEPVIDAIRKDGPPTWVAQLLRTFGAAKRIAGELDAAQAALHEAAGLAAPVGNDWLLALTEYELGLVAHARGEPIHAEDLLHAALGRQARHDLRPGIAATLDALGALALDAESTTEAVRCFAAADTLRSEIGLATRPIEETRRSQQIALAQDLLGTETFERHWAEAANLPLGDMIEYVSRARGERKRPSAGWDSLTPTELRIVALVATGLTNPQIAERMFIARGTVKVHLSHVFTKLEVSTRAELATRATKRGLAET